jgi:A/G-specific adenine glycosylase
MQGRTRVTEDEIVDVVDIESAIEALSEAGIEDASTQVQRFVSSLPDLLEWFEQHGRQYPWRETADPWRIYATEILLQRTRADAVDKVYTPFFERFETPQDLRDASEKTIRETVRSLGFVNHRVRTLKEAVEMVCDGHDGEVPDSIEQLKQPWRVGDYTARAVCIFAHGDSLALVDTNFARVLGRFLGYDMPNQPHKSKEVYRIFDHLVPKIPDVARAYNFAILDLGALICVSGEPLCGECPVSGGCTYFLSN